MHSKQICKTGSFVSLLVLVVSFSQPALAGGDSSKDLRSQVKQVYAEISEITGEGFCQSDDECEVLGIGQEACGGPGGFEVYSKRIGDAAISKLQELSKQSSTLAAKQHLKNQMMGACRVLRIPRASCINNVCKFDSPQESASPQSGGVIVK